MEWQIQESESEPHLSLSPTSDPEIRRLQQAIRANVRFRRPIPPDLLLSDVALQHVQTGICETWPLDHDGTDDEVEGLYVAEG